MESKALVKSTNFVYFIDIQSMLSRQIICIYGANASPCKTPVTISKLVSLSGEQNNCFIFALCMELNALEKSINNSIALRFFVHSLLMI